MRPFRSSVVIGAIIATLVGAVAVARPHAAAPSVFYDHGKTISLVDSFGCAEPDMLHDGKLVTIVAFTDGPIDKAKVSQADNPCSELADGVGSAYKTLVELKLKYDGTVYNVQTIDGNGTTSQSGQGTLTMAHRDAKHVDGSYMTKDASKKKTGAFFDLHFSVDIVPAK